MELLLLYDSQHRTVLLICILFVGRLANFFDGPAFYAP